MSDYFVLKVLRSQRRCERIEPMLESWILGCSRLWELPEPGSFLLGSACCVWGWGCMWLRPRSLPTAVHSGGAYKVSPTESHSSWKEQEGPGFQRGLLWDVSQYSPSVGSRSDFYGSSACITWRTSIRKTIKTINTKLGTNMNSFLG